MMSRPLFLIIALVAALPASAQTRVVSLKAADEVGAVSFSPHGDKIAAGIGKDRIAIWSLPDGKLLQDLKLPHTPISMLFARADEIIVALADGAIEVRALTTGTAVRRLDAGVPQPVLAVSTDGRLIASSGTEQIRLWDSSGKLLRTLSHEFGSMASLAFSPDGTLLASAGFDTNVHLWDVSTQDLSGRSTVDDLRHDVHGRRQAPGDRRRERHDRNRRCANGVDHPAIPRRKVRSGQHELVARRPIDRCVVPRHGWFRAAGTPCDVGAGLGAGRTTSNAAPGAPAMAAAFTTDGRLLYATAKGQELNVWVLAASKSDSSNSAKPK